MTKFRVEFATWTAVAKDMTPAMVGLTTEIEEWSLKVIDYSMVSYPAMSSARH